MIADDVLSKLLTPLRLRGVFQSRWTAGAPWAVQGSEEHCAVMHYVISGQCLLTLDSRPGPIQLHSGDLVLFPHGTEHTLSDAPDRTTLPLHLALPERPPGATGVIRIGGSGDEVQLICAGLHYAPLGESPLYRSLPPLILITRQVLDKNPLLLHTLDSLVAQCLQTDPGNTVITLRAFEMVLLLALQLSLGEGLQPSPALEAVQHPGISKALSAMHSDFGKPWSLPELAREAGMSRSSFSSAFRELLGESPARHLTRRRMQEAARLLTETADSQHSIAAQVGYQSTVGLHLAFRKWFQMPPGEYRTTYGSISVSADRPPTPDEIEIDLTACPTMLSYARSRAAGHPGDG
ncbi:AraC family transcriptional regulator [Kitasatospora sp. MAP5-34]|uniref:AraC family transcriptional regulator n=1 Tax=Kitasatospora sp. MAP5-34 TaxID=3035102 RepID=UPI0024753D89|nr:AraC family transcriptional regulator [Kitasatospora sp. MAP5-34]MDH6579329.1 AraC family transcriptional activator of mtrCDE [Kitasatospora sp. MAP5-34]